MYPKAFKSQEQWKSYVHCLNRIQIGDQVAVIISGKSFVSITGIARGEFSTDPLRYNQVILPIIGRSKFPQSLYGEFIYFTAVGVINEIHIGPYYQNIGNRDAFSIPEKYHNHKMYLNSSMDLVYTKVIKGK